MFGSKRRRQRKLDERAELEAAIGRAGDAVAPPPEDPVEEPTPERSDRPLVALLTEGERLGFDPELHIPSDGADRSGS